MKNTSAVNIKPKPKQVMPKPKPQQQKKKSKAMLIVPAVLGVVLLGAAGAGGWYFFLRHNDPLRVAEDLTARGDLRGAQIELRNAVRTDPNSADAHLKLGQTQMMLGDPVAAEKELKTARDLGMDRWTIIPLLGQVYMAQSHFQDVLTEVPPDGPKPDIAAKNMMLRAMAQVGLSDFSGATTTLNAAEKLAPDNVDVLLTAARLALVLKDIPLAEKKVDQALKTDPQSIDALLTKGQILTSKGDKAGGLAMADRAVELAPDAAAPRLDRANQLITSGQDAKAQIDVNAVLKMQPRNAGATYLNAVLMIRLGRYSDAQLELQKLAPVIQRFPRALYFQALAAANLGQSEQAIDFANRYVNRAPSDPDGIRLVARTELAAQRPERAIAILQKAIDAGQADGQMLDLLGRAYALMGKAPEAVETFKKANLAAPGDPTILTHLASSQMQEGDSTNAALSLEKSIDIAPKQPNAGEALVAAALSAGDVDKAEQALNRLRAQAGDTEAVGILTGMLKLGKLDLEGGRAAFAATLKQFPDSVSAKLNLAKVLILQGRKAEGEALLKEILAKDPANIPTLNTAIQLSVQSSQFPQAIQMIEAARTAAPKNLGFTAMLSDLIVRSGDPRRAVAMLTAMRSSEELQPNLLAALARAQAAAGLTDDAKKTYSDVLKTVPNDLDARRGLIELQLRANDMDGAMASLKEALAQSPGNIGVMASMVALAGRTSDLNGALRMAQQLRADPANLPNSTVLKGDALMEAHQYADAAQAFQEEYKVTPTGPLLIRLANALVSSNQNDKATAAMQDWLKDHPADVDVSQMLSLLDIRSKRYADAETHLNTVLAKKPNDSIALNNMAWLYSRKNDPRARIMAQRAYLQAPTAETGDTLGWIMVKGGDATTGLPLLQQASRLRPNDSTVKYHLALALKDTGQTPDAVKVLQPIVSSADDFDDKPAARALLEQLTSKTPAAPAAPAALPAKK